MTSRFLLQRIYLPPTPKWPQPGRRTWVPAHKGLDPKTPLRRGLPKPPLRKGLEVQGMQTQMEEFMRSVMDQRRNPDAPIVPPGPAAANIIYIYILYIVHMLFCFSNIFFPYESWREKTHLFLVSSKQTPAWAAPGHHGVDDQLLGGRSFFFRRKKMVDFCFRGRVERSLSTKTMDFSIFGT